MGVTAASAKLSGMTFDVACDFIGFVPSQLERDYRLLKGKVRQFMYISSASAYQKPCSNYVISEKTPLAKLMTLQEVLLETRQTL